MVIGKGLVARNFSQYETQDDFLIFASGVSNSKACTNEDFLREKELLSQTLKAHPSKDLVYFSTSSILDPDLKETPYIRHKLNIEDLIRSQHARYHIFRLSNLAGHSDNPATVINFLYGAIIHHHHFDLWGKSERNIIDTADVYRIANHILQNGLFLNEVINIANKENYPVKYIVNCIEEHTRSKANFTEIDKGGRFIIDVSAILPICDHLGIGFGASYLPQLLNKYFPRP